MAQSLLYWLGLRLPFFLSASVQGVAHRSFSIATASETATAISTAVVLMELNTCWTTLASVGRISEAQSAVSPATDAAGYASAFAQ
ncbi:hypothetical protein CK489_26295 [Bradyrhizobium sp. UFLA03-84]|nr:hypothetical protein CK489_26295 [Bradyrhizobium sp. UFLA03-84]